MHVALLQVRLHLPEVTSLKEKRSVVKSILERSRSRYAVAAAETDDQDVHRSSVLGFAAVSASESHAREVVLKILDAISTHPVARLVDHEVESY